MEKKVGGPPPGHDEDGSLPRKMSLGGISHALRLAPGAQRFLGPAHAAPHGRIQTTVRKLCWPLTGLEQHKRSHKPHGTPWGVSECLHCIH